MRAELFDEPWDATVQDCRDKAFVKHAIDLVLAERGFCEDDLTVVDLVVDAHFDPDKWAADYWQGRAVGEINMAADCPHTESLIHRMGDGMNALGGIFGVPSPDVLEYIAALLRERHGKGEGEEILDCDVKRLLPYLALRAVIDLTPNAPPTQAERDGQRAAA